MWMEVALVASLLAGCSSASGGAPAAGSGNDGGGAEAGAGQGGGPGSGGGAWTGTEHCAVAATGTGPAPAPQQSNVTILASQITETGTELTLTGLTVGPVGGWSCPNQTLSAPEWSQYGIEWFGPGSDAGAFGFTPCAAPSASPFGPTVMFVLDGQLATNITPSSLNFLVQVTSGTVGPDGGVDQSGNGVGFSVITCSFALKR